VLVLDLSTSVRGTKLTALRSAARAFLEGLREGERAALLTFDDEVRLVAPPTGDLEAVRQAVDTAAPRGSTALVDGVYAGLRLLEGGDRRTVVLAFSDGLENRSWLAAAEVVRAAAHSNAVFYAVTVRAPGERPDSFLRDVAHATGGRVFEARSEQHLQDRFLEVLADIRARYVLSYAPTAGGRPGWHALDVRMRRGKGSVLARPGYWLTAPAPVP
jgi:VWFA-related protein